MLRVVHAVTNERYIDHRELFDLTVNVAAIITAQGIGRRCYPVPRGGVPAMYALLNELPGMEIADNAIEADFFLDDIIDSGDTRQWFRERYHQPFYALVDKLEMQAYRDKWVVFPWEESARVDMETTVTRMLQQIGEDPKRGGLIETPARVAKAWSHWTNGYGVEPSTVLKEFEDGGELYDEMIMVRGIPFYSHCEHHMAPFFGTADIAYIPNGKIVGLSKLSRLLDVFAHRLQVQERLTGQVAGALMHHLDAKGAAVSITARHLCMESRGIQKQGSETVTTALLGVFRQDAAARAEFLSMVR